MGLAAAFRPGSPTPSHANTASQVGQRLGRRAQAREKDRRVEPRVAADLGRAPRLHHAGDLGGGAPLVWAGENKIAPAQNRPLGGPAPPPHVSGAGPPPPHPSTAPRP